VLKPLLMSRLFCVNRALLPAGLLLTGLALVGLLASRRRAQA
jgi:hypothetical protein